MSMGKLLQDGSQDDWTKLAQRTFQVFLGAEKELSAKEEEEVQKAANAEAWVHEVRYPLFPATQNLLPYHS